MKESNNAQKRAVQKFFTENPGDYSRLFSDEKTGKSQEFRQRLMLAAAMTSSITGKLLDCACGPGEITAAILGSGRFTNATVIDLSPRMLELAKQRITSEPKVSGRCKVEFKSLDIFEFSARPHSEHYDLILCLGLIAHTGRLDDLLAKLEILLSPQGSILLQSSLLDHMGTKVVRALTQERYYRKHGYRISYFLHQDILRAAQSAGLKTVAMRRFAFGLPFGDRIWAAMNYHLEKRAQNLAKLHGSEAMYLLQHNAHEH